MKRQSKKRKTLTKKKQIKYWRYFLALILFSFFYFFSEQPNIGSIEAGSPPEIFSNQARDDLKQTYAKAIEGAEKSIDLFIYTLSDKDILRALNKRAEEGLSVKIYHDPATDEKRLSKKIQAIRASCKGLMHQKILIIDEKDIWIGSANFSRDSLKVHDNLVVALSSPNLAERILNKRSEQRFQIGDQLLEFWKFPEEGKEGLLRLIEIIDAAKSSIKIAMYTWTHPLLTHAVKQAALRGVKVEIVMDKGQGHGVNAPSFEELKRGKLDVHLSLGPQMLHHKFAWIDNEILVSGSANWTKSAFSRNEDCFVILHNLTEKQQMKLHETWNKISKLIDTKLSYLSQEKHFPVLGQRPAFVGSQLFEPIDMAA